jgi:hypothetical protein
LQFAVFSLQFAVQFRVRPCLLAAKRFSMFVMIVEKIADNSSASRSILADSTD